MSSNDFTLGNGQLRRSNQDRGPEMWGRLRMTREQLTTLVNWANANPQVEGYNGREPVWELELAGWTKEGPSGKYLSLALSQPYKSNRITPGGSPAPAPAPAATPSYADDLPF